MSPSSAAEEGREGRAGRWPTIEALLRAELGHLGLVHVLLGHQDDTRVDALLGLFTGGFIDIGRDPGNGVPMPNDTNTSRKHATISGGNGQFTLTDNGSSNGTFLNGVRAPGMTPQPLRQGDEIQVGMTRFRFEA